MTRLTAAVHPPILCEAEKFELAVVELAEGMRKLEATRLKMETIVTLLHANSGVSKREIRLVLNNLLNLEEIFLKPKK